MRTLKTSTRLEQLVQIANGPVWDGDLISKGETQKLAAAVLIIRSCGVSSLSSKRIEYLSNLDLLRP